MSLPDFPGAATVYERAEMITHHLCRDAYASQTAKGRTARFRFNPPAEAEAIIRAMNSGDEEALKAANHEHRHIWENKP